MAILNKEIVITDHANKRLKERLNIPKKSFKRTVLKAYESGIGYYKAKGKLKTYINSLYNRQDGKKVFIRVYGEYVYIFSENVLITVHQIPNEIKKYIKL